MSVDVAAEVPLPDSALTAEAARELTDQIQQHVSDAWTLIERAYLARAWVALQYASWDEYCAKEFDRARIGIPREERSEVVASLRVIGMSTRAIAAATGLSKGTVQNTLAEGGQNCPPDSVVGLDGKQYQSKPVEHEPFPSVVLVEGPDQSTADGTDNAVTRRRRPITEAFDTARSDLLKKADALARLAADDRFDQHADQLAHRFLSDLLRAQAALQSVIDRLPHLSEHPEEG
ncbi:hypothetical protein [Nocardia sp. NPDC056000]|uniref:hypothetical protein n=1 Tax=Nocardia sp. NPDC056000 TaxID=3345674 RepID=UPI0035D7E741